MDNFKMNKVQMKPKAFKAIQEVVFLLAISVLASCSFPTADAKSPQANETDPAAKGSADSESATVQLNVHLDKTIVVPPEGIKIITGGYSRSISTANASVSMDLKKSQVVIATDSTGTPVLMAMGQTPVSPDKAMARAGASAQELVISPRSTAWALIFLGPIAFANTEAQAACVRSAMENTDSFKNLLRYLEERNAISLFRLDENDSKLVELLIKCNQELQAVIDAGIRSSANNSERTITPWNGNIISKSFPPTVWVKNISESMDAFKCTIAHNTHWPRLVYIDTSEDGTTYSISPTITGMYDYVPSASNKWYNCFGALTDLSGLTHLDTTTMNLEVNKDVKGIRSLRISTYAFGLPGDAINTPYDSERMLTAYIAGEGQLLWQLVTKNIGSPEKTSRILTTNTGKALISKVRERAKSENITISGILTSGDSRAAVTNFFKEAFTDKTFLAQIAAEACPGIAGDAIEKIYEAISPEFKIANLLVKTIDEASKFSDLNVVGFSQLEINNSYMVADPVFSLNGGTFSGQQTLTLSCPTPGSFITYTQGSVLLEPTVNSTKYASDKPIQITSSTSISARAFKAGMSDSRKITKLYTINTQNTAPQTVPVPVINPPTGTYASDQTVTISCAASEATIYFTTNDTAPTVSSTRYTAPFTMGGNGGIVRAIAVATGKTDSSEAKSVITINRPIETVATPVITPATGTFTSVQSVSITCATSGATIRYTTDDSEPTESSPVYGSGWTLSTNQTIRAKAFRSGMTPSGTARSVLTFNITVPVTGITLNSASLMLTVGGGVGNLTATVNPANATDKNVIWSSSNTAVATVSNGTITPLSAGNTTVTAKAGSFSAGCTVTVLPATVEAPVFSISSITSTGATFSWAAVTGATKYRVYVSTGVIDPKTATTGIEIGQTSYVYTSGSPNTLYHVAIAAYGAGGLTFAQEQTFTTAAASVAKFILKNANTQEVITQSSVRNLGSLNLGDSIQPDFSITNGGTLALTIQGSPQISFSGTGASEFSLVQAIASPIASTSFTNFSIKFQPTTPGSKNVTVTIQTNDPLAANFSFILTATVGISTPGVITASSNQYSGIVLNWGTVTGATDFEIQKSSNSGFTGATSFKTGFTYTYTDSSMTTPATWYYRIRALNGAYTSGWSATCGGNRQPIINSSPSTATTGTLITQTGSGFTPNGNLEMHPIGPDGNLAGGNVISLTANGSGSFSTSFTVSAEKLRGTWILRVKDLTTGIWSFDYSYIIN